MRKLALAASLAASLAAIAAAAPAHAQSSVSIYGRLNVTVEAVRFNDGDRESIVNDNSSRIGFKGTEDLGGGLKAGFQIEHGFDATNGQAKATFWGRQSEVNLTGSFGTVRLGAWTPDSYFATSDYIGMHNHETGDSADAFYASNFAYKNKVGYTTPNLSGFQGHIAVAESDPASGVNDRNYDLAAFYDNGPLHLGAGFEKQGDLKQGSIRALYDASPITVGLLYQRSNDFARLGRGSRNYFRVSAMYVLGRSEYHVNVGAAGEYAHVHDSDALQMTVAYNYNLSKRTKAYAYYTRIDRDNRLMVYGGNYDAFALGIRHNF